MKIVFIVDYYFPVIGGAEILNQKIAESLALHHEVCVLTQQVKNCPVYEELNGVKIYRVKTTHRSLFPYQGFTLAKKLVGDADIVQAAPYGAGVLAARVKKYTKAKVILLVYEYLGRRWLKMGISGFQAFLYEKYLFYYLFDHYIAISDSTKNQLLTKGIPVQKVTRIYCGIDYNFFKPQPQNLALRKKLQLNKDEFVILFAGRPGVTKGVFLLVEAMRLIRNSESRPEWNRRIGIRNGRIKFVLILAKEPARQRREVERLIRKYHLEELVLVLDSVPRSDLPKYFAMADTVIVPSLSEGFGFMAAEVSAMEIPLIVSRVDSLPEVVSGKVIFMDKPSSIAIVEALQLAFENKFVSIPRRDFSWSEALQKYEDLYRVLRN